MPLLPESSSYDDFGGNKINYSDPVDATTDRDASEVNGVFCDVAMMSRAAVRGWLRMTLSASTPVLTSTTSWNTTWKGATSTPPVLARSTTGVFTITFPSTVNDEAGNSHTVNIQSCQTTLEGSTFGFVNAKASSANVVTVNTANSAGSANDLAGVVVNVWFNCA